MATEYKISEFLQEQDPAKEIKEAQEIITKGLELGLFNEESFMIMKKDGSITISSDKTNEQRIDADKQISVSTEKEEIVNRKNLTLDDLTMNNQKFNMQLLELSDTKVLFDNQNDSIGNLNVSGTVLVKTWDLNLKRYVLTRRTIRTPLFSAKLNNPEVLEELDIDVSYIESLDINLAERIKNDRIAQEKITEEMSTATGGTTYSQGNYNSYLDTNNSTQSYSPSNEQEAEASTSEDIVNFNPKNNLYCWPAPGSTVVTAYIGDGRKHDGWDISTSNSFTAYKNNMPICAARAGTVEIAVQKNTSGGGVGGYGACVVINHGDNIKTLYGHMKNDSVRVKVGQKVEQGQHIGTMGNTGYVITSKDKSKGGGTHLHFSIYLYDNKGNKVNFLNPGDYINPNS